MVGEQETALLQNLPGMAYRCRNDRDRTMEFVSEGCLDLTGHHPTDLVLNRVISYGQLIHPQDRGSLWSSIQAALCGKRPFRYAYRITTAGGEEKWVWEQGGGVWSAEGELLGMEGFVANITDQLSAYQALERRVAGRTRELSTLLEVSRNVASTLELEPLLGLILDQLKNVMDYSGATIFRLRGGDLTVLAYRGPAPQDEMMALRYRMEEAGAHRDVVVARQPCIIPDIRGEDGLATAFRESAGERLETTFGYVRSWMGVPLIAREQVIGMLSLYHDEPDYYTPRRAQLALAFASAAAMGIENARLYGEEQERRREAEQRRRVAEGLREILTIINSNRPPDDILDHVVSQAGSLLGADAVVLYRRPSTDESLAVCASQGLPTDPVEMLDFPLGPRVAGRGAWMRQPVVVSDLSTLPPAVDSPPDLGPRLGGLFGALLAVPVVIQKEVYGGLELYCLASREFSGEDVRLALAFADQAALAIQNARLRVQVEQTAATAERNRLARDLHDAVTQTLFSASLLAEVLPRLSERNPQEARRRLEELRQLTRGALAEMRTLLLELRPSALTEVDLGDLLRQLAEAITGRTRVPVALSAEGKRSLPPDVQVVLYRIAQEALNNMAKHAVASCASVELRFQPNGVELSITDDGCGFDPKDVSAEHLGLGIMGERAESIGALLKIESQVGQGTRIVVDWVESLGEEGEA